MIRPIVALAAVPLLLAACQKSDDGDEANGFVPPTVTARADFIQHIDLRFHRFDRNGDNVIDANEIPAKRPDRILRYDANHDGKVTWQEYRDGALARFDKADANHDGTLTTAERLAADTDGE